MVNHFVRARKLLLTIYKRYKILPNWVDSWYQSGKLPLDVEKAIEKTIGTEKETSSFSIKVISNASYDIRKNFIQNGDIINEKELEAKGWFFQRLPKPISEYFKKQSK